MKKFLFLSVALSLFTVFYATKNNGKADGDSLPAVHAVSAMREVMHKGDLDGKFRFDTLSNTDDLYGIGPLEGLRGEILIMDGKPLVSTFLSDSTMKVEENFALSAPFFVYSRVAKWQESSLPDTITDLQKLEVYLLQRADTLGTPFCFQLKGKADVAEIHVQNLPAGTKVSSPKEAHQGQVNYILTNKKVQLIGFFSKNHQGIFTHHDTYMHLHLVTDEQDFMGHLDAIDMRNMTLYLPNGL